MLSLVKLRITGRVQGVFYRHSTRIQAQRLALTGWVRNLADGSVEALASGPRPALEELIEWCKEGPPNARVDQVEVKWLGDKNQAGADLGADEVKFSEIFEIR